MDISKFSFSDEVRHALTSGDKPVVALESTIISHGMPYPQNYQTAVEVEEILRKGGCVPATIGIIEGVIHIGMSDTQLEKFAKIGRSCNKVSRRDISRVVGLKLNGATTVAGTMYLANVVGIRSFVTGGIGGVHRGAETTFDVSADLTELGRTPVAVVCAGAKSILDIPKTLEYLETQGVMVYGWKTTNFPGFWTPDSGYKVTARVEDAAQCGEILNTHVDTLKIQTGMVFAVPLPVELSAAARPIEEATQQAVRESVAQNIEGKDATPFLLQRINEITKGASLKSNIALVKHNALVGAQIAVADHALRVNKITHAYLPGSPSQSSSAVASIGVIGGALADCIARPDDVTQSGASHTSHPGKVYKAAGGVGLNLARTVAKLDGASKLYSVVGSDADGRDILRQAAAEGVDVSSVVVEPKYPTPSYVALLDGKSGSLIGAVADTQALDTLTTLPFTINNDDIQIALIDTNFPTDIITAAAKSIQKGTKLWADPVSVPKASRLAPSLPHLGLVKPCAEELGALLQAVNVTENVLPVPDYLSDDMASIQNYVRVLANNAAVLIKATGVQNVIVSVGPVGVILVSIAATNNAPSLTATTHRIDLTSAGTSVSKAIAAPSSAPFVVDVLPVSTPYDSEIRATHFSLISSPTSRRLTDSDIVDVTGAGDSLLAATAWSTIRTKDLGVAVVTGMVAARLALLNPNAVCDKITQKLFVEVEAEVKKQMKIVDILAPKAKL